MQFASVDPGESTGYAVWDSLSLADAPLYAGTAELGDFIHAFADAMGLSSGLGGSGRLDKELRQRLLHTELLVYEDWQLYPWKLKDLAWDYCRTVRGIGALEFICQASGLPYIAQPAAIKDAAEAAGAEAFFLRPLDPNRHANDAIRHGVHYKATRIASMEAAAA